MTELPEKFTGRVQKYRNETSHTPSSGKYDMVQLKYDGWWARCVVSGGTAKLYSRQNQLKDEFPVNEGVRDMVLIGEYLKGTNRATSSASKADVAGTLMVFDALQLPIGRFRDVPKNTQWMNLTYGDRLTFLHRFGNTKGLPSFAEVAETWPLEEADALWRVDVLDGGCEGLVYRNSKDFYEGAVIGRKKQEFTMDYIVMDVVEGAGKRQGMVGALLVGLMVEGELTQVCRVGGGFNDELGTEIFQNFSKYKGRVIEAKGWQVFKSGALRHPNFVRWRDDKSPEECLLPI